MKDLETSMSSIKLVKSCEVSIDVFSSPLGFSVIILSCECNNKHPFGSYTYFLMVNHKKLKVLRTVSTLWKMLFFNYLE